MPRSSRSQAKVACLTCRSNKTRCDGQQPCANCLANERECNYLPSRRGGPRRGERYQNEKKQRENTANHSPTPALSPFHLAEANNCSLDSIAGLVCPFNEVHRALGMSPTGPGNANSWIVRAYQCEPDLINAYYIFIHPYLPLLPPPAVPRFADAPSTVRLINAQPDKSSLPFCPTSPFGLALMAILVLIPLPEDPHPMHETSVELRRSYANMYAEAARECVEASAGERDQTMALHPEVPPALEPILALLLLGVYEYCQRDNRRQMRSHVYHALTISMDISLHAAGSRDSKYLTAQTRSWWMTMFLVYQSSIFNHSEPIMLIHDARITTPLPEFFGYRELLPALMRAQDALIQTGAIVKELTETSINGPCSSVHERVRELDSRTLALVAELDQVPAIQVTERADAAAAHNLRLSTLFLIYIARIKLHRLRAFGDAPVFLSNFCDLQSINSFYYTDFAPPLSSARLADIGSIFPFTEQESVIVCLKAALGLSRILRNLPWPNPSYSDAPSPSAKLSGAVEDPAATSMLLPSRPRYPRSLPYLVCGGMQSCYVHIMLLRKVRTALHAGNLSTCHYLLSHPESGTENQDAERLIEELRHGVESVYHFMASNAVFEGVVDMLREVETVHGAHFPAES